jgi:superfamily I DNA/RNA helicase/DNA polymerase III epsilon subunit-like protein
MTAFERMPASPTHPFTTRPGISSLSSAPPGRIPSPSQRAAIESPAGSLLVLAGPGAGKTFCLIERIRFLLEKLAMDPARICAFTFTNKAAGEIAERLARSIGDRASLVKTGTIHAFCTELLREFGSRVGLERGFGIADEKTQHAVLRRIGQHSRWNQSLLKRFSAHRLNKEPFTHRNDAAAFAKYERFLQDRNLADFDMLVIKTAELLTDPQVVHRVRARWDCVLVDEFQDLNPLQYQVIRELGRDHGHIFAVGDEEQSIYSWAGADPRVFIDYSNDFAVRDRITLRENRRCTRDILALARRLVEHNPQMFDEVKVLEADRDSAFCVAAHTFPDDDAELSWLIDDVRRDHDEHGTPWGDIALLYRSHGIGDAIEARFLSAGLPCRLASGRALAEDPIVAYVIAALQVIASPDDVCDDAFLELVLPAALVDEARALAQGATRTLRAQLESIARERPLDHADAKKIRRACYSLDNLEALARQHETLTGLVEELLSHRVAVKGTVLEEQHDALSDPESHAEVVHLTTRLVAAREARHPIWIERRRGVEIALKGMLEAAGYHGVSLAHEPPDGAELILADDAPVLGLPLALFKALQLAACGGNDSAFRDFTAVDIETTSNAVDSAEVVEIAAVRVRNRMIVDEYHSLVRPTGRIEPGAERAHGISEAEVADAPAFDEVWPRVRELCGGDVVVAHNGHHFDFPILRRLSGDALCTYDTLPLARSLHTGSAKLSDLARHFGIDTGKSHRALDDTRALVGVCLALHALKESVARKTALVHLLDFLGVALALWPDELDEEGALLRDLCRPFAFGRFSTCLDYYELGRAAQGDDTLPTAHDLIVWLGGAPLMERIRAEKSADERYPAAMGRLRRLLDQLDDAPLGDQLCQLLERVALSRADGAEHEQGRVNLLTLHSTKGLEFSRVYVVGVEDAQLPGGSARGAPAPAVVEEARRLLYVGMTRAKDRLVLTHTEERNGRPSEGHRFMDEMGLVPTRP